MIGYHFIFFLIFWSYCNTVSSILRFVLFVYETFDHSPFIYAYSIKYEKYDEAK